MSAAAVMILALALDAGDDVRAELTQRLEAHGIVLRAGVMRAKIVRATPGFAIEAVDAVGRKTTRNVSSIAAAATWIESWARADLAIDLLRERKPVVATVAKRRAPPEQRENLVAPLRVDQRVPVLMPRVPIFPRANDEPIVRTTTPADATAHPQLSARAESMVGSDGSVWFGGAIGSVVDLFGAALLADARVVTSGVRDDGFHDPSKRLAAEALIKIGVPMTLGPIHLLPNAGAGVAWMRVSRNADSCDLNKSCSPGSGDGFKEERIAPRLELALHAGLPISKQAAPDLVVAFSYTPWAHSDRFYPVAADEFAAEKNEVLGIAGEPEWYFRFGLGFHLNLSAGAHD